MKFLIENGIPKEHFSDYFDLGISPHHIHKTKYEHKKAVLLLAHKISKILSDNSGIIPSGVARKLENLWERFEEEGRV